MSKKMFKCAALVALVLQDEKGVDYRVEAGERLELPDVIYRSVSAYVDVIEVIEGHVEAPDDESKVDETTSIATTSNEAASSEQTAALPEAQVTDEVSDIDADASTGKGKNKKSTTI